MNLIQYLAKAIVRIAQDADRLSETPKRFPGYKGYNPTLGEMRQRAQWNREHPERLWWQ